MDSSRISEAELDSLVALLDDRDDVVTECVDRRLLSFGPAIVRALVNCSARQSDAALKSLIETKAGDINAGLRLEEFSDFVKRQKGPLSLFEAAFIISSIFDCNLQRDPFEDRFFKYSGEYLAEHSDARTGIENIRIFNHIFFHRLGFTLYDVDLTNPQYAIISNVLRTKEGNPFALAFIYFMIAQVAGLPLRALCFPGGFVPVYVENGKELFYINVYRGGEIFLKDRLKVFLSTIGITSVGPRFRVRDDDAILTIYLESLLFIYSNLHDEKKCPVIERALDCIGSERFLTIDEEE